MSVLDIIFIFMCLGVLAALIIHIIKIETLVPDMKNMRKRLDAIEKKTDKNKDHTDLRISRINRIMDTNIAEYHNDMSRQAIRTQEYLKEKHGQA